MRTVVVGTGDMTARVAAIVRDIESDVVMLPLERVAGGGFNLGALAEHPPSQCRFLAAVGPEYLNLLRLGLYARLRLLGYKATAAISTTALIPDAFKREENVQVGPRAVIGERTTIAHNVHVGAAAVIGRDCVVDHSVWIAPGVILGDGVHIGEGTVLGSGVIVMDRVAVGRQCELGIARQHCSDVPDRTFESVLFDDVVRIRPATRNRVPRPNASQASVEGGQTK